MNFTGTCFQLYGHDLHVPLFVQDKSPYVRHRSLVTTLCSAATQWSCQHFSAKVNTGSWNIFFLPVWMWFARHFDVSKIWCELFRKYAKWGKWSVCIDSIFQKSAIYMCVYCLTCIVHPKESAAGKVINGNQVKCNHFVSHYIVLLVLPVQCLAGYYDIKYGHVWDVFYK